MSDLSDYGLAKVIKKKLSLLTCLLGCGCKPSHRSAVLIIIAPFSPWLLQSQGWRTMLVCIFNINYSLKLFKLFLFFRDHRQNTTSDPELVCDAVA